MSILQIILLIFSPVLALALGGSNAGTTTVSADVQRRDDISRFITAANDYQANNYGKTPWDGGTTSSKFVRRYIDDRCTAETPEKTDNNCGDQFRDPDGTPYHFSYKGELKKSGAVSVEKDHGIYVYTYATCGKNGELERGSGKRQYAMLYKLSDGSITCNDNH
jgi:hypothetical protein